MTYWIYRDTEGKWQWYLEADNGDTLAKSGEAYPNRDACELAINVVKNSSHAPIEHLGRIKYVP